MKTEKTLTEVVEYAKQFEGVPYIWAGNSFLTGLDCSGYAQHILLYMGLYDFWDRTVMGIRRHLIKKGAVESAQKKAGSFLFFGESADSIEHIEFAISDDEMIGASGAGSNCKDRETAKALNARVHVEPINYRRDFLFSIPVQYKESL